MEEPKHLQRDISADPAAPASGAVRPAAPEEEGGLEECRICRSSAQELLEAEGTADGGGGDGGSPGGGGGRLRWPCCRRQIQRPPLRRLRCACAGSVRHVCASCYRRYYVARGIRACEICCQPTGLEGEDGDGSGNGFCQRLTAFACSNDVRYLAYAAFILCAFASVFILFFVASAADEHDLAQSKTSASAVTPRPESQRRTERAIFVGLALVNLSFALAYISYSFWSRCRRRSNSGRHAGGPDALTTTQPPVDAAAATVAVLQQLPSTAAPPPLPPALAPLLLTPQLPASRAQQLVASRTFSV